MKGRSGQIRQGKADIVQFECLLDPHPAGERKAILRFLARTLDRSRIERKRQGEFEGRGGLMGDLNAPDQPPREGPEAILDQDGGEAPRRWTQDDATILRIEKKKPRMA